MKAKKEVEQYKPDDRVVLIRKKGDMDAEDFGASGMVLESSLPRFGPWINNVFYYFGTVKEFPAWCIISTDKLVLKGTRHFAVRIESIKRAPGYDNRY